ncbi:MAG TPA: ABC transporter permease [Actinopolymorphaceae bacterium]
MLRRNLVHLRRYPSVVATLIALPVIFLLLFVYVFGGTLGNGLGVTGDMLDKATGGAGGGRAAYVNYVVPGILMLTAAGLAQSTAISVGMDMTEGIIARFRTMAISRAAVLTGHVLGSLIQALLGLAVVVAVALLVGFRPSAGPLGWIGAVGIFTMLALALTWVSVAFGLVAKSVESASNLPMPLMLLPFLGSGFVPTESMSTGVRWFAEYQPFTPINETLRGLLMGTPIGVDAFLATAWCLGIGLAGYLWARRLYDRERPAIR